MPDNECIITADAVITMNDAQPRAEAVAVARGRVVAVGSLEDCRRMLPAADVSELAGSVLMPGFVEPHSHPLLSGMSTEAPAYNIAPWLVPSPRHWRWIESSVTGSPRSLP